VEKLHWFVADKLFDACDCIDNDDTGSQKYLHSDRVQILVPSGWSQKLRIHRGKLKDPPRLDTLDHSGAVIFGKSRIVPLKWGDDGEPQEEQSSTPSVSLDAQNAQQPPAGNSTSIALVARLPAPNASEPCITAANRVRRASIALTDVFVKRARH
jgi:hypothetical protein